MTHECTPVIPDHPQTPFTTLDGESVDVDEGLYDLLSVLRAHGVRTQWSCQECWNGIAYFVAERKGSVRLLRKIKRHIRKAGKHVYEYRFFAERLLSARFSDNIRFRFNLRNNKRFGFMYMRYKMVEDYELERDYTSDFGLRIVFRWPAHETYLFTQMLREML